MTDPLRPPAGKCRGCGSALERDRESKKPRWHCTNIACLALPKPGTFVGTTRIVGKK